MGDRANFGFKDSKDNIVFLYGHWAGHRMLENLADAVSAAEPRWQDPSYALRIIIDQLTKDSRDSETGHGIFLAKHEDLAFLDYPVIVDLQAWWIQDESGEHQWSDFINYHSPKVLTEQI